MDWSFTSGSKCPLLLGFNKKNNIIARSNVQHITRDEAENPEIHQSIRNYYTTLDSSSGADKFMSGLGGMDAFINEEVPSQKEDVWEEPYQVLPDSPDMENVVDQENSEKSFDTYDQFVGAEVCLSDEEVSKWWPESPRM